MASEHHDGKCHYLTGAFGTGLMGECPAKTKQKQASKLNSIEDLEPDFSLESAVPSKT